MSLGLWTHWREVRALLQTDIQRRGDKKTDSGDREKEREGGRGGGGRERERVSE